MIINARIRGIIMRLICPKCGHWYRYRIKLFNNYTECPNCKNKINFNNYKIFKRVLMYINILSLTLTIGIPQVLYIDLFNPIAYLYYVFGINIISELTMQAFLIPYFHNKYCITNNKY
jgi:uncharacterized protein YbaR (Trm112 family)